MRRFRIIIGVALIGLASVVLATPAGALGPTIAVSPSTGLADGQTVTVTAGGFTIPTPTFIGIEECSTQAKAPYENDCDTSTATIFEVTTDNYTQSYDVVRHITTPNEGAIDCALPDACEILSGGAYPDTSQEAIRAHWVRGSAGRPQRRERQACAQGQAWRACRGQDQGSQRWAEFNELGHRSDHERGFRAVKCCLRARRCRERQRMYLRRRSNKGRSYRQGNFFARGTCRIRRPCHGHRVCHGYQWHRRRSDPR